MDPNSNTAINFVTGASGLVGSHLIRRLLQQDKAVRALYRSSVPQFAGYEKVDWVKGDILDIISLEEAMQGVALVYHCAAIVSFEKQRKKELFATNIEGTANVVNAATEVGIKKLCYVSSVAAIGKHAKAIELNESMQWTEESNSSNYAKSKHLAEIEVWRGIGEGLPAVIVNPSIILGAGNWNDGSTKIFKTAYNEFPYYTEGVTGFVGVDDVVTAMIMLMESDIVAERFILNAENKTYKEVFTTIAEAFNKKPPHKKVNRLLADIVRRADGIKSILTGGKPLLTKETAEAAQAIVRFSNNKIKSALPGFTFKPLNVTIAEVCLDLKRLNNL